MQQRYILLSFLILLIGVAGVTPTAAQLSASADTLDFGRVRLLSPSGPLVDTLFVQTGGAVVTIDSIAGPTGNVGFGLVDQLQKGTGVRADSPATIRVVFFPYPANTGLQNDRITIYSSIQQQSQPPLTIALRGVGVVPIRFSVASLDFGRRLVGKGYDSSISIRNMDSGQVRIIQTVILGDTDVFSVQRGPLQPFLRPQDIDSIKLRFAPPSVGVFTASLIVRYDAGADTLPLHGEGVGAGVDSLVPRRLDFGTVERDRCRTVSFALRNNDVDSLPITSAGLVGGNQSSGIFTLLTLIADTVISAGDSLPVTIRYCPQGSGCDSVALRLMSAGRQIDIPVTGCAGEREILVADTTGVRLRNIDFGTVDSSATPKRVKYSIINAGSFALEVDQKLDSGNDFHLSQSGPVTLDSGDSKQFEVILQPERPGILRDTLVITSNATTPDSVIRIPIAAVVTVQQVKPVWEAPTDVEFGNVHLGRDSTIIVPLVNLGAVPVNVQQMKLENPFGDVGFSFAPKSAQSVRPGDTLSLTVSFAPKSMGRVEDVLTLNSNSSASVSIRLSGTGISDRLVVDSTLAVIRFDSTALGSAAEAVVRIMNTGNVDAQPDLGSVNGDGVFTIVAPVPLRKIAPGGVDSIMIRYVPDDAEPDTARWNSVNPAASLLLIGAPVVTYRVRFDTVAGAAGDLIAHHLLIEPGLIRSQGVAGFTASLHVEPTALFAERAVGLSGRKLTLTGDTSGRITVTDSAGSAATVMQGDTLCTIYFRGLATGRAGNIVALDSIRFIGSRLPVDSLGDGLVLLSGCDIGRASPLARRSKISRLKTSARVDQAELTYRAAEGVPASVRIVDIHGQLLRTMELPEGTGEEQTVAIPLTDLPEGLLLLELRVVNDRTTVPLMIVR